MSEKISIKTRKNENSINHEKRNKLPFSVVEAYKNLRLHLISNMEKTNSKVIAISSANASDGKTTTAINVAISLSQLNKKVIMIDADSRRATIHQKLKIENNKGCLDILTGATRMEDAIVKYNSCLDIITAGTVINNPTELFSSNSFERMITELRNIYDYVIIDTPPVNVVSEALVIAQKCDGLVYVVRTGVTTYDDLKNVIISANQLNIKILGAVMNGIDSVKKHYRYNYYSKI